MADNTQVAGGTGDTVRDKDRAGVKTQIMGLDLGIGDAAESLMSATNAMPVKNRADTATLTNVSSSVTNVTVLASNTARKGATVFNDSTSAVYLKFGATASATSFTVKMAAGAYFEVPFGYTGIIDGIWVSANGSARVTELT
jgi:hypothetical protein